MEQNWIRGRKASSHGAAPLIYFLSLSVGQNWTHKLSKLACA